MLILTYTSLFFAGLLTGEEFIVRYGVQPALTRLDDSSAVRARKALVARMKIVVPALMLPTVLLAIAVLIIGGTGGGFSFRIAGVALLVAFLLFSFLGTVPINIRVNDWDVDAPPADWKRVVHRWETIDIFRSSAAILAFALLLVAAALSTNSS